MFACKRTSQKGFSLVELMVVVAIIGVLASIAVPQVNKFIAKARQSEAKSNLASFYTSQKAFQAEYGVFDSRFRAVGFAPEGELRYNVGTGSAVAANLSHGYNPGAQPAAGNQTSGYCALIGAAALQNGCRMLAGAGGAGVQSVAAGTLSYTAFTARAAAVIINGAVADQWTITDSKELRNIAVGIP